MLYEKLCRACPHLLIIFMALLVSCSPDETEDSTQDSQDPEENCLVSGDILVSNSGSDAVIVFDSAGNFKRVAFSVNSASESLYGLVWSASTNEVIVAVDGVDRVVAISAVDCGERTVVINPNLTGNIRGITQLTSGDILVVETNNIERFGSNGNRVTSGWPLAAQTAGTGLGALSNGGFVLCSSGTDVVRAYSATGVQSATRSSGIAATTDAMGCIALANGNIAATWSGTSDTIAIYNPALSGVIATYSNTAMLGAPGGLAEKSNGNIVAVDRVFNQVVEITSAGVYVGSFGSGYLSTPEFIAVVP